MVGVIVECRSREVRKICEACHKRKARFQYAGHIKADRDHTLCFECFRAERNRQRVRMLAASRRAPLTNPGWCVTMEVSSTPEIDASLIGRTRANAEVC